MTGAGLIISAPASGTGKTTVTLGLIAAFRAAGIRVQPFKCGPDYIDPAFHAAASGRATRSTLTPGRCRPPALARLTRAWPQRRDLIIAEGSMGLFDGVALPGETGIGASADLAELTGWPVVLVIDCSGQAQSAAAVCHGLAGDAPRPSSGGGDPEPHRLAPARGAGDGWHGAAGITVLGALPRRSTIELPERHLGLVQAGENPELSRILSDAGAFIAEHCDLAAIRTAARPMNALPDASPQHPATGPAHRAGAGSGVFLHLSAPSGRLAGAGGGNPALLAAGGSGPR
ncbi:MAG: cobyrinic acid a,c-diamide synthase [Gemmobacter sp.]|nr:cobyrinic acid a,c-diamide synthase [Gemmobacter sp.]